MLSRCQVVLGISAALPLSLVVETASAGALTTVPICKGRGSCGE